MATLGEDIYEYHFANLFGLVKDVIGEKTIKVYETKEEEQLDKETDEYIGKSNLLFDLSGDAFKRFKARDSEYKYWVEVYVTKMIKNLLMRNGKRFEEKYHPGDKEQHSIVYKKDGRQIEAYFLFDMEYEEATRTDYDKIADVLTSKSQNIDKINIYIFRDDISKSTCAWLLNVDNERNANGLVEVLPLHCFFEEQFGKEEYTLFEKYANEFHSKCNSIISYKTVISPTQKTLEAFRKKKLQMLRDIDYLSIAKKVKSGELSETEFEEVENNYLNKKMYMAMVGTNDYADSFISAEWSYDVYSNSMGELELTGIIAGYLKSVEQLMYTVVKFHRDQDIKIKIRYKGRSPYTKDNEQSIDSTLRSLNDFIKEGNLALSTNIRGCIHKAVDLWGRYQRNGYFHKDNLYLADNRIDEVRALTIYLYFLILGGISFSSEEMRLLGVRSDLKNQGMVFFDEENEYPRFRKWIESVFKYDLPENVSGIWVYLTQNKDTWNLHSDLLKYFYIDDFESGSFKYDPEQLELNHTHDIPPFVWKKMEDDTVQAALHIQRLLETYMAEPDNKMHRIQAIIGGFDKEIKLIYFNNDYTKSDVTIKMKRVVNCPYCNEQTNVDLSDSCAESTYDRPMGTETLYEFDTTAVCDICGEEYGISGYISEYPPGSLDSEDIKIRVLEDIESIRYE